MNTFLKTLFDSLGGGSESPPDERDLPLATAALLIEMMRADRETTVEEEAVVRATLRQEFSVDEDELNTLIAEADAEARNAAGYFTFTRRINDGFSHAQKLRVIEYLWRIALADGHLAAHENHLMRKLADLIHISHGDYHAAKTRAQAYLNKAKAS